MKTLRALNTIYKNKKEIKPGETFECEDAEARRLIDCSAASEIAVIIQRVDPAHLNAEGLIALINTCETAEAVDEIIKDETRNTILKAADVRKAELAGGKE